MNKTYKLLTETEFDNIKYETELCESTQKKNMYISGITLQGNIRNRNGRIYPSEVLDEAVNRYITETNDMGLTMEGELKHPDKKAFEVDLDRVGHRFVDVKKDADNWHTKALILETPQGQQIKNLMNGGVKLGISSRCIGQVKNLNGTNIVQSGLKVITLGDVVHRGSAPDALLDSIYENKEFIYENGVLIEKDISEELDTYKKLISKTTKKDRAEVFAKIIEHYFKTIKF